MPLIEAKHLSKSYGAIRAVRDVSFAVDRGAANLAVDTLEPTYVPQPWSRRWEQAMALLAGSPLPRGRQRPNRKACRAGDNHFQCLGTNRDGHHLVS